MSIIKTFLPGGLYPPLMKDRLESRPIENASIPPLSIVPMLQHRGEKADCVVHPRDYVREGTLIGRGRGKDSCNVHSPVPGIVKHIREITLPWGDKTPAVFIELGGEFNRLGKTVHPQPWEGNRSDRLLGILEERGVVGMYSGIPIHRKLAIPEGRAVKTLIINGIESEPYLCAGNRIMVEKAEEIISGARLAAAITKASRTVIALTSDKKEARDTLGKKTEQLKVTMEICPLMYRYPLGNEKLLIKAITGEEVPQGKSSMDLGAVVLSAGTVLAMYDAVVLEKPFIEKSITVAGKAIRGPANLKVRIGTPIADLVEECGGFVRMPEKVVVGGPMTGWGIADLYSTPVTKTTSGVLFLCDDEIHNSRRTNCLNCGRCTRGCPMGLSPAALYKLVEHSAYEEARAEGILDCLECGSCTYTCPARIPVVQEIRAGKLVLESGGAA